MERPGRCRWCACTWDDPCPSGCAWANEKQTLCTACVNVDREWRVQKTRRPNMRRAFFRGYMVGSKDERGEILGGDNFERNPYHSGAAQQGWWRRGFDAGTKEAH